MTEYIEIGRLYEVTGKQRTLWCFSVGGCLVGFLERSALFLVLDRDHQRWTSVMILSCEESCLLSEENLVDCLEVTCVRKVC